MLDANEIPSWRIAGWNLFKQELWPLALVENILGIILFEASEFSVFENLKFNN